MYQSTKNNKEAQNSIHHIEKIATMRLSAAITAAYLGAALAFVPSNTPYRSASTTARQMSTEAVPITVTGNNIEVTPALNDYIVKKLERTVGKLASSGAVKDCDVHLVVNKNPKVSQSKSVH